MRPIPTARLRAAEREVKEFELKIRTGRLLRWLSHLWTATACKFRLSVSAAMSRLAGQQRAAVSMWAMYSVAVLC